MKPIILLLAIIAYNFNDKSQVKAIETQLEVIDKIFSTKTESIDPALFKMDPSLCNFSGHWKGSYTWRGAMHYDYDLYLTLKSPGEYTGYAQSKGKVNTTGRAIADPGKDMMCKVTVIVNDTTRCDSATITEHDYLNFRPYEHVYWPLKIFKSQLIPARNKLKINGFSNNIVNYAYDLTLSKVSDVVDPEHSEIIVSLDKPQIEITEISFLSEKNLPYLGYLETGKIKFIVKNNGKATSPGLYINVNYFATAQSAGGVDPVAITGGIINFNNGIDAGQQQAGIINIKANDRILADSIRMGISISALKDQTKILASKEIRIPVKQKD